MRFQNDDFYIENGNYVFTAAYHKRRGTCCGSGCRHCPFDYENVDLPNFFLNDSGLKKDITDLFLSKNIATFAEACQYIAALAYRRPSENSVQALFNESCGTCSTKHTALKMLADEQGFAELSLFLGIYAMSAENTPKIGNIVVLNGLQSLPEAHTYLKYKGRIFDFTNENSHNLGFRASLWAEIEVDPSDFLLKKAKLHQSYLKKWLEAQPNLSHLSLDVLWQIREKCIAALSL